MISKNFTSKSQKITLKDLLKNSLPEISTEFADIGSIPNSDVEITGVTDNSKEVYPGNVFVAYHGERHDAHQFIDEAIERGASSIVVEKEQPPKDVPIIKVNNGRKALAKLASSVHNHPGDKLKVIGVTGTNGKTTTTAMINHIIRSQNKNSGLLGTVHYSINGIKMPAELTTPQAKDLYKILENMVENEVEYLTSEVSSHGLKQDRVSAINFDIAGFTNISRDHMDFHDSWDDYVKSKAKFFQMLSPESISIINADDNHFATFADKTLSKIITYGIETPRAMIKAKNIKFNNFQSRFTLKLSEELPTLGNKPIDPVTKEVIIPVPGRHNIYNGLLALTSCIVAGFDIDEVIKNISNFPGIFRRLQVLKKKPYTVLDDCAHNVASMEAVFNTISELPFENLIIVIGVRGNRGKETNKENSSILSKWIQKLPVKKLVITTSESHAAPKDQVQKQELEAFLEPIQKNKFPYELISDLKKSIKCSVNSAETGDLVLILGPYAMDKAQNFV
ncbi:Mur ligase family protein [Natranaerobius trueperi]|uniref:UDP-N-acetylmuramyl peptide synthase n=1 Tax=Natranaerobius trueperi TaxID=759412 RepID=A0A226BXZ4_9FIRM|nr:UDP-N-acetylmuramyl-tripeptide synthetase [Natranaerobius trueperi]OWZ83642.1 UDP-N-acetylmuramyl peptide synthase [Natranaerobius trueperi]